MNYLVISNLLVFGALFFSTCPTECRPSSCATDYKPRQNSIKRVIRQLYIMRRSDPVGLVIAPSGESEPITDEPITTEHPTGTAPPEENQRVKLIFHKDNAKYDDKREVSQQRKTVERRSNEDVPSGLLTYALKRCQDQRYIRTIGLQRCLESVVGEAMEDITDTSNGPDLNNGGFTTSLDA